MLINQDEKYEWHLFNCLTDIISEEVLREDFVFGMFFEDRLDNFMFLATIAKKG